MEEQENRTRDLKFYSQKAIGIATFIGGPMAAGYLIRENYRSLDELEKGKTAFIIGVLSTLLLFVGIFLIPESILEKVPNQILPAVYTGIIYVIVDRIHGAILKQHKDSGNEFHSGWKAAGIGTVSLIILLAGIFGYAYLSPEGEMLDSYDKEMQVFMENEEETLKIYDVINSNAKPSISLLQELDNSTIPKWRENIAIIEKTNGFENLPQELVDQNKLLMEYAELRLEAFKLLRTAIHEDTDKYSFELDNLYLKIDEVLEKLN